MVFARRKSVAAADAEAVRPRNRLSKPMTSKSPTSQRSSPGKQSPKSASESVSVSSQLTLEEITRTMSKRDTRAQLKTHLFEPSDEVKPKPPPKDIPKKQGVASLVMQFESASASQLSLNDPILPSRPLSSLYGSRKLNGALKQQHMHNIASHENLRLHKHSISTLGSPTDSLEQLVDPFTITRRRSSNFRPGDATRKPSAEDKENMPPLTEETRQCFNVDKSVSPVQPAAEMDYEPEQWTPPPPLARAETPASLDVKAIGSLRLGSLHVVNGRTSPVLSELSRHLISQRLRDVSSEYADSQYSKDADGDAWEDAIVNDEFEGVEDISPQTPTRTPFDAVERDQVSPLDEPVTPQRSTPIQLGTPIQSPDKTSMMAQAYMRELQGSPFSFGSSSPASTGSVVHHQEEEAELSLEGPEDQPDNRRLSLESEQPSLHSKPSAVETFDTRDQVFSSAMEYQAPEFEPPLSPERGIRPTSSLPYSPGRPLDKVDSGYNSGNSIVSINMNESSAKSKPVQLEINTGQSALPFNTAHSPSANASPKKESSPRKFGKFFGFRSSPKKSATHSPIAPSLADSKTASFAPSDISYDTTNLSVIPDTIKMDKEKSQAVPKKLQKPRSRSWSRSRSRAQSKVREPKEQQEIMVHRLASCDSTLDIPAISEVLEANLKRRSQQIPELEMTFKSQDHIKNQPSMNSLAMTTGDIRFPSPYPVSEDDERFSREIKKERDRSKSRPRSKSRRRSFLDMFRSDKDIARRNGESGRDGSAVAIADFGDVVASLGSNPYDIAHSRPRSRSHSRPQTPDFFGRQDTAPRTNPHDISINRPRQRTSMTDEQASEYARLRSHSFNGHSERMERRPFIDDRGGIGARLFRSSLVEEDVPPIPPMPDDQELRRISQRHSLQSQPLGTPIGSRKSWAESPASFQQPQSSPAPPPPAHSPRPSFVNQDYEQDYPIDDEMELGPPPPSHSPRPMDISEGRGSVSPWDAQARAWKEKRLSAGEMLRNHRYSNSLRGGDYHYDNDVAIEDDDEHMYPVIPPKQGVQHGWSNSQPNQSDLMSGHFDPHDHLEYPQRSQTWDNTNHNPYHFDHDRPYHSQASFQSRQKRHHTWDEHQDHNLEYPDPSQYSQRESHESRQTYYDCRESADSRQTFYSHRNCPIDRPFDGPQYADDFDDYYEQNDPRYGSQTSPLRGRPNQREQFEYNGYERDYYPAFDDAHGTQGYPHNDYHHNNYAQPIPRKPLPQYQYQSQIQFNQHRSRGAQTSPTRSYHTAARDQSPNPSRPSSRHSQRSNASAISLAEELHPEINKRPSPAPDFGRYSGGMNFGYEGRDRGFGGSAGTRSVSGKADAMVKGQVLRESHGVDLGDVPVIGVVKKI